MLLVLKETKSATMNIFRIFSFVKVELSYVFKINLFTRAETTRKGNYLIKQVCFSRVGNYLRPSNNYRQLILT